MKNCIECNKEITKGSIQGRCRSCSKKGKRNGLFKHGFYTHKRYCIDCKKELNNHNYKSKRCKKCGRKYYFKNHPLAHQGKKNPMYNVRRFGKNNPNYNNHKLNGNTLENHHKDLDRSNNCETNILRLPLKIHRKVHLYAYRYLVKKGMIKKYMNWFFKYGIKTEKYKK
jgi:hypothetical protein